MDPYVIVLARNSRQGMQYAKAAGLARGRFRVAHSAKNIRNAKRADVHILDSFWRRPDRYALIGALRYTKGEWFSVSWPFVSSNGDIPQMSSYGDISERDLEVAYRYNVLRDLPSAVEPPALHADLVNALLPGGTSTDWDAEGDALDDLAQVATVLSNVDAALSDSAAEVLEKPKRRRRRHAECGQLHFPEEPCPTTFGESNPDDEVVPTPTPGSFFGGS